MSLYRLQIVRDDGAAVRFRPGSKSEEGDLYAALAEAVCRRGVGVFVSEAGVRQALAEGLDEVFLSLKRGVVP